MVTTRADNTKPRPVPPTQTWTGTVLGVRYQLQAHLGGNLQAAYQPVVEEPIPVDLLKLLERLQRKEKGR
jgi:hypothetical protein